MALQVKRKFFFHLLGAGIVAGWLVTMALLILRVQVPGRPAAAWSQETGGSAGIDAAGREWKEIFLKDKKVGYAVSLIKPVDRGYFIQEEIFLRLNLMGLGSSLYTVTQCKTDRSFLLENFIFSVSSGIVQFRLSGKREGNSLIIESGSGKEKRTQTVSLQKVPVIGATVSHLFKARKLTIGETFSFPIFDPSTMSQRDMAVRVLDKEPLRINRLTYDAFRLETEVFGRILSVWVDEDGSVLKEEGFMGLTTIKSSAARAPENLDEKGTADLYEITAVSPDRALPDPKRLSGLKIEISGLENGGLEKSVLNGDRQEYRDGRLSVRKEKLPSAAGYSVPYKDEDGRMKEFLQPEWNIESDEKEIRNKAFEIVGEKKDAVTAAKLLTEWVYRHLEKRPVLSLPSALETLRTRMGDCNEHATLLTAFLRAVGIPARLSIGLAYSRERFFYHAWTEAYVGEWVSMDATLNQMPADPAHIKLIEGNLEKQVEIAGIVGQLRMKILDFQYE
ncbi:MAG: hypothetical protein CVU64_20370 [Deltaproteobacteria bacterium HGW-Deltaproteobacteria-21]|nr:MAG: hypothetical protein CVU64_20370 [Deltaproteobacteria bacterium HGW-Deltaproteobacteria-21]